MGRNYATANLSVVYTAKGALARVADLIRLSTGLYVVLVISEAINFVVGSTSRTADIAVDALPRNSAGCLRPPVAFLNGEDGSSISKPIPSGLTDIGL